MQSSTSRLALASTLVVRPTTAARTSASSIRQARRNVVVGAAGQVKRTAPAWSDVYRAFASAATAGVSDSRQRVRPTMSSAMTSSRMVGWAAGSNTRAYATQSGDETDKKEATRQCDNCPTADAPSSPPPATVPAASTPKTPKALAVYNAAHFSSLPLSLRRMASRLPAPSPGRPPSVDQVLGLTTSFFERLRIRFKWLTIRSYRRFRVDDYGAFLSVGLLGGGAWLLIGTTSFLAFIFLIINSLQMQEAFAAKLGEYLTSQTGLTVVFESAIVPKWGFVGSGSGSKIVFKNVYVARGHKAKEAELSLVRKPKNVLSKEPERKVLPAAEVEEGEQKEDETSRWTQFHVSIDTVEVTLSLRRWLDGKGLVNDASIKGVRGVIDRSHVVFDPNAPKDRTLYRHPANPGDFWLESLQIEDFLVTIYQPESFRPYTWSIFNASIGRLRKQWLFYDLMSAETITGQVDNCLYSLHRPQSIGRTSEQDLQDVKWARMSRFRVDGVPVDHLLSARDTGVLSWVTSGRCDLVADIHFPHAQAHDEDDLDLSSIVAEIVEKLDEIGVTSSESGAHHVSERIPGRRVLSKGALEAPKGDAGDIKADNVSIDLDIRFKDLKASVPIFSSDLSYINSALIRPIVAFVNSNRTLIPVRATMSIPMEDFDGSWTTYDVGLLERMSEQVYSALAHHVQSRNDQRLKDVGIWTLKMTADALLKFARENMNAGMPASMAY